MRWFGGWRDKRAAHAHHKRMHIHYTYGYGSWIEREEGCPWCEANKQWWVDLRAAQAEGTRKHRAKLDEQEAAYRRVTK